MAVKTTKPRWTVASLACAATLALILVPALPAPAQEAPEPPPAPPASIAQPSAEPMPETPAQDAPAEPETIELVPIPEPDLTGLEPEVAAQLGETRAQLEALLQRPGATRPAQAEALGELGRLYHAYELNEPAEAAYYDAHLLAPEDARWSYLLGHLSQQIGKFEQAAVLYGRALERQQTVAAIIHLAETYIALEQLDEAEKVLRYALSNAPELPSARALMGEIALSRKEYSLAVEYLESALSAVPEATRLHYPIALAYRGLGDAEKAQEHLALRGEIGVRPADPLVDELQELKRGERVYILRGRTAFRAGDWDAAAREFRKALESDPESVTARVNLGSALGQAGDRIGAIHQFRQALERAPDNAMARYNLGVLLGLEGRHEEALEQLRAAAELEPRDAESRRELAKALIRAGQGEAAAEEYLRASDLAPFDPETRLGEVQILLNLGRYEEARERMDSAHALMPREPTVVAAYARLLAASPRVSARDGERAVELATGLMNAMPTAGHAEVLALALGETGRCDEAEQWQRRALETYRQAGEAASIARVQAEMERYQAGPPCRAPGLDPANDSSD
jgi:tetratricopeptide (TPR) repeat protein